MSILLLLLLLSRLFIRLRLDEEDFLSNDDVDIYFLHVDADSINQENMIMSRVSVDIIKQESRKEKNTINKLIDKFLKDIPLKYKVLIKNGNVVDITNEISEELKPDLIIIGNNGRNNISDYVLGTTAMKIVKSTKFPILVVPTYAK